MLPVVANTPDIPEQPPAYVVQHAAAPVESPADQLARRVAQSRAEEESRRALQPVADADSAPQAKRKTNAEPTASVSASVSPVSYGNAGQVRLPARIPANCITDSARIYGLNPMVLLAILKVESSGRTGIVSRNKNGTYDLGPAQFNTSSWAKTLQTKYNISREALINDMCQAVRAMAFAVRTEINQAGGNMWRGIGNYHSRTPVFHDIYVGKVHNAHRRMLAKGAFE